MVTKIFRSELGRGSLILFATMNLYNILNFLFHFYMGRTLGPADYGTLAVLMSLVYIYSIPSEAIQTIISKYVSVFNAEGKLGKIKYLISKSLSKGFQLSLILLLVLEIFGIFLSIFLRINYWLIFTTNILIFFSVISPITKGILQGRKKFSSLGINMVAESGLKLVIAAVLVMLGFRVFGALWGVILGLLAGFLISIYLNRDVIWGKSEKTMLSDIYQKSIPYFTTMIVILLIFSSDIILAKRFFDAETAGKYAVLSMIGKMIFFGTVAVSKAVFPITSERHEKNKDSKKVLKKAIGIVGIICLIAVLGCWMFPELIIKSLYGAQYTSIKNYLVYSGIAFSFLSLSNLVLIYALSASKPKKTYSLGIVLLLELILLSLFHKTISEYVIAFMVSNIIMFIFSLFLLKNGTSSEKG